MAITRIGPNQSINLASNITGTLPVGNGGTAITSGFINGTATPGKVLQVINSTRSSNVGTSTQTYVAYLDATITPSSSSNKIFIAFTGNGYGNSKTIQVGLFRGGISDTLLNTSVSWNGASSADYETKALSISDLDSPSTTSAQIYTVAFRPIGGDVYAQLGEAGYSVVQNLTLMEIAG